jgi:hypothetical protein
MFKVPYLSYILALNTIPILQLHSIHSLPQPVIFAPFFKRYITLDPEINREEMAPRKPSLVESDRLIKVSITTNRQWRHEPFRAVLKAVLSTCRSSRVSWALAIDSTA